jgi:MFS family permease
MWLVASRLAILMGGSVLTSLAVFYLARTMGLNEHDSGIVFTPLVTLVALGTVISVVPAARISDRVGRKRVIWASCAVSAIGLAIVASAPSLPFAFLGALLYGISAGMFLAVDWALMTDIIPKAASGRYMGISNVATSLAGPISRLSSGFLLTGIVLLGLPADVRSSAPAEQSAYYSVAPRIVLGLSLVFFVVAAWALRRVDERRRED